jgi:heptosyltransferase-2
MTLPAMVLVRRELQKTRMTLVIQERYRHQLDLSEIGFETAPEIEGVSFRAEVAMWREMLRTGRYDAVVFHRLTRPDFPAVLAAYLENIPHRMGGAEKGLQGLLTDVYCPSDRELVVEYHWNLIRAWLHLPPKEVDLHWPPVVRQPLEPKRYDLLIAPYAQHTKEWPSEHWHELLKTARSRNLRVALSAGPAQSARAAELLIDFPEVENLSLRSSTMEDLFRHVQGSSCVVALDTGIRHVAAALGVPCVVLGHGREHFRLFGAYVPTERYLVHLVPCAPCGAEPCPLGHLRCIREISVPSVLEAWQSLMPTT